MKRLAQRGAPALFAAAALALAGCANYQLGSPAKLPFDSIYIRPAANESFAPQVQKLVSAELRQRFIRDGRVRVVANPGAADAVLDVTLTNYGRESVSRRPEDTVTAIDFRLDMDASVSLYDNANDRYFFEGRTLSNDTFAYANNPFSNAPQNSQDFNQAEFQVMPDLARGLARKIADEVLGAW